MSEHKPSMCQVVPQYNKIREAEYAEAIAIVPPIESQYRKILWQSISVSLSL